MFLQWSKVKKMVLKLIVERLFSRALFAVNFPAFSITGELGRGRKDAKSSDTCLFILEHRGGRAESASASLKNSCSRSTSLCLMLFCSSLVLTSSSSYIYRAPLVGLLCSVVIVLLHYFLFVPFLLTVMPPQKKKKRHVGKKKLKSEINNGTNTPSMNANQPSEEPKRQNSNTLKVPGRQREKLERTEHVTSV